MNLIKWLGQWIWKTAIPKSPSEFQQMQEYYQKYIEHLKKDYEERIKYIQNEKKKHPENGIELQKHMETLDFYYKKAIELSHANKKLMDEVYGLRWQLGVYERKKSA